MPFEVGQSVIFKNKVLTITSKAKGSKTKKPDYASGIVFNGYKSKPCVYTLSDGSKVRGAKLKKL